MFKANPNIFHYQTLSLKVTLTVKTSRQLYNKKHLVVSFFSKHYLTLTSLLIHNSKIAFNIPKISSNNWRKRSWENLLMLLNIVLIMRLSKVASALILWICLLPPPNAHIQQNLVDRLANTMKTILASKDSITEDEFEMFMEWYINMLHVSWLVTKIENHINKCKLFECFFHLHSLPTYFLHFLLAAFSQPE